MEDLLLSPSAPMLLLRMEINTLASSAAKRARLRLSAAWTDSLEEAWAAQRAQ